MSTESNVSCVVCDSKDAFTVFDFSLKGEKWAIAEFAGQVGKQHKGIFRIKKN